MKKLISLLLITLLVSCGKNETTSSVVKETPKNTQCEELKHIDLYGEYMDIAAGLAYKVNLNVFNAECSYNLNYDAMDGTTKRATCETSGKVEIVGNKVKFIPDSSNCDDIYTSDLSCNKNDLTVCKII